MTSLKLTFLMFHFKAVVMNNQELKYSNLPPSDHGQNLKTGNKLAGGSWIKTTLKISHKVGAPAARPGTVFRAGTSCHNKTRGKVGGNHQMAIGLSLIETSGSHPVGQTLTGLVMIVSKLAVAIGNRSIDKTQELREDRTGQDPSLITC